MVENITEYNIEVLKEYIKFNSKRSKLITLISSIIIFVCGIIEIILNELLTGLIFIVLACVFFSLNFLTAKIAIKQSTVRPKIKNIYFFEPDKVKVTTYSAETLLGESIFPLNAITKVVENETYLYLYINRTQALIVDIKHFKDINDKELIKKYIENSKIQK